MANRYPPGEISQRIQDFAPVAGAWAAASGLTLEDVRQELALAAIAGLDPAAAVPRALGIRRVGGVWRSMDPAAMAAELDGVVDTASTDEPACAADDSSGIALALAGGSLAVATRCGVGLRAAQLRIAAQAERFAAAGDLFAVVED